MKNIIARYFLALVLSLFPFAFPLREDWWVIPLIIAAAILQFVLATVVLIPDFKKLKNKKND